jgi:hypothetical protein
MYCIHHENNSDAFFNHSFVDMVDCGADRNRDAAVSNPGVPSQMQPEKTRPRLHPPLASVPRKNKRKREAKREVGLQD